MWWRRLAQFAIAANLLVGAAFVALFEVNLHCTQHTSFRIATFDLEPHVEEQLERSAARL